MSRIITQKNQSWNNKKNYKFKVITSKDFWLNLGNDQFSESFQWEKQLKTDEIILKNYQVFNLIVSGIACLILCFKSILKIWKEMLKNGFESTVFPNLKITWHKSLSQKK